MKAKKLAAAVAVGTTDAVFELVTEHWTVVGLQVKNVGANPLDAFEVWGCIHPDSGHVKLLGAVQDFTTTKLYPLRDASGSPISLSAGATAWMIFDVAALAAIEVRASAQTGVTTLDIYASVA